MNALFRMIALAAVLLGFSPARAEEANKLDMVLGSADAPVTIIEYASLTCGHCANFHKTTMPKLKAEWLDKGRAKLIYRDFPTGPRHLSVGASMITHCVAPMRYFGLVGLLMEQQDRWMGAANPLVELKKLAKLAGLGEEQVDACLKDQALATAIDERAQDGAKKYGIEGTPAFIINGKLLEGAQPYEVIDAELQKAAKAAK